MSAVAAPFLVVDDDPNILATLTEILELEGHRVRTAANGREALDAIDREAPWLVLLDMRMPVLDGWGFARELDGRKRPKILVMTAAENAKRWADEIAADGYLAKPFDLDALLDAISRLRP